MNNIEIKIQNLINKRQLAIQLFSIVTGGTVGLLLLPFGIKTVILLIIGIYYALLLLTNYIKLDRLIDKQIELMEKL